VKLAMFMRAGGESECIGAVAGDRVIDLTAAALAQGSQFPDSILALIAAGEGGERILRETFRSAEKLGAEVVVPLEEATLKPPIARPGKIIGVGLNYSEHVSESSVRLETDKELPERPVLFDKPSTAIVGPEDSILHDASLTAELDWEVELAVVIGRPSRRVSKETAYDHVYGYSIINDISARDQRRAGQWFFSKGQDSYAPFGPVIVTADEVDDPLNLNLRLRVNDVTKQDSNTRHMLFKIPELIADITSGITLEPGDVIATGSPAGVGAGRTPPEFLRPGDVVEAAVEGIGVLRNHVVDAAAQSHGSDTARVASPA